MGEIFNYLFDCNNKPFSKNLSLIMYSMGFLFSIIIAYMYDISKKNIKNNRKILYAFYQLISYILIALPVASFMGYRDVSVGFDTNNYINRYFLMGKGKTPLLSSIEIGFSFLTYIDYKIFEGGYAGALFPMSLLTIVFISRGLDLWNKRGVLPFGLFLFYCYFGLNMQDQGRQILSLSVLVIGFYYFYKDNNFKFNILVLLSASIHLSSILMFVLYVFKIPDFRKRKNRFLFYFSIVGSIIALYYGINYILSFVPAHYKYLLENMSDKKTGMKWVFDIFPFVAALLIVNYRNKNMEKWGVNRLGYYTVPFRLAGYKTFFIARLLYYPGLFGIVTSSNQLNSKEQKNKSIKKILIIIIFIMYYYVENFIIDTHRISNYTFFG